MTSLKAKNSQDNGTVLYVQSDSDEWQNEHTEEKANNATTTASVRPGGVTLEYDDSDDQLMDTSWRHPWNWFIHDFLHDNSAMWFLLIHVLVFFFCIFFGPMTLPLQHAEKNAESVVINKEVEIDATDVSKIINLDLSHLKMIRNTVLFMFATMITYTISLFVVLLIRYIAIKLIIQPMYNISRLAIIVTYAIDPAAAYLIWGIINYGIFRKLTKPAHDAMGHHFHRFLLFGRRASRYLEIDHRCYTWANSACHLQILIAMRRIFLSSFLFLFEVSFLPNYSSELKGFLTSQALLRKFNVAWLNFVNKSRSSESPEIQKKVEAARLAIEKIPMPETPIVIDHHTYYASDNFKIFRPNIHRWRRLNQSACDMNHKINHLPQFYKDFWIKQCSRKYLTNWSALHYMVHHPPELLFMDYYVPLISKSTVQEYSRLLFDHIYETMVALNMKTASSSTDGPATFKPALSQVKTMNINLEPPLDSFITKNTSRFSNEPVMFRSKSSIHISHLQTSAIYSDSSDDGASIAPAIYKTKSHVNIEDRRRLTPKMFKGLNSPIVDAFFSEYDIGNCGYICANVFTRNVLYMCSMRKRLLSTLKNQRSILLLVGRLLSTVLWFIIFVMFLMTSRVDKNILLPSTIGFLSAMIVALSYMYTSFITAIIFVVLSNPYNVGDRIRINQGEAMFVQAITTYNTTFRCIHGKIIAYQNSMLSTFNITNETRARHAAHEIAVKVGANTTPAALKKLIENLKSYVNGLPRRFVKEGCYIYLSEVQVNHYFLLKIVLTYMDGWQIPSQIFLMKNDFILHLAKQCKLLGITYKEAVEPISFCGVLNYGERGVPGHNPEIPLKFKKQ